MANLATLKALHARGDLVPYLEGKTECIHSSGRLLSCPAFQNDAEFYTFRPIQQPPKPPELRPFTREEWIERRDWWVRDKFDPDVECRVCGITEHEIAFYRFGGMSYLVALENYETSPDCKTWYPCGLPKEPNNA